MSSGGHDFDLSSLGGDGQGFDPATGEVTGDFEVFNLDDAPEPAGPTGPASVEVFDPQGEDSDGDAPQQVELAFGSLPEFVQGFLVPVYRRAGRQAWCVQWWEHAEAIVRLEAMWDAFEAMRLDPGTGASAWLRDHFDYHMGMLTNPDTSPFAKCSADPDKERHVVPERLRTGTVPPGLFTYSR